VLKRAATANYPIPKFCGSPLKPKFAGAGFGSKGIDVDDDSLKLNPLALGTQNATGGA